MRASLSHHLWAQIRRGRARALLRTGLRALAVRQDLRLPARFDGPLLATLAVTYRCPLACGACTLSRRAGAEIPDAALPEWVDALADLAPAGLGFTGGEPLLRRATLPAIERAARRQLLVHLNTSGLPIGTPAAAARLLESGVASVNVSIDHPEARVHDVLRGRQGSQRAARRAVELLARARGR
ncbi:MAG: radical SAM protein, partial [Planctomycetes bacterium]|nr:radical SAM protein [Planctomycetota bacterium]